MREGLGRRPPGWKRLVSACRRHPTVPVGATLILLLVVVSVLAPFLAPYDPYRISLVQRMLPPLGLGGTPDHLLGTDPLGRDALSRVLYAGRISLAVAATAVLGSGLIGISLGLVAGYYGGRLDDLIMRVADVQLSFPVVMLAISLVAVVGTSLPTLVVVLAISGWVLYARTVRSMVLSLKQVEFVAAAKMMGAGSNRIMFRHILTNVQESVLVIATVQVANMILLESGLSFLGLGVQPPEPSWGGMLADGRDYLSNAWWIATVPGIFISLAVLGANLLGDGLRDMLDPRLRGE
ncbi:MAG: ABC transporter permease [Chloroflexota bacterium]